MIFLSLIIHLCSQHAGQQARLWDLRSAGICMREENNNQTGTQEATTSLSEKQRELFTKLLRQRGMTPTEAISIERSVLPGALSFAQERLWFLDHLNPGNSQYNVAIGKRIKGQLNIQALKESVNEIISRHDVLRTSFPEKDGSPILSCVEALKVDVPVLSLESLSEAQQSVEVRRISHRETTAPFDLSRLPLLRTVLLRLGPTEHVMLLVLHHIVIDGWSVGIFFRELSALYRAFTAGVSSTLAPLTIQYADFARWQRKLFADNAFENQLRYWKKELAGAPELLKLPSDRPRPAEMSFSGSMEHFELNPELTARLKALSKQSGITLYMLLLAAFSILLARYSGMDEVVVGSPIANRSRKELEPLIGLFVNTLALRMSLKENPSVLELLRQVKEVTLAAYANQDVPFEKLVEELQPVRSLSHHSLFQVFFVFQNISKEIELPGLSISSNEPTTNTSKFDLTLSMAASVDTLKGHFEYSTDLFERDTIVRLIGNFETLLQGIVDSPEQKISHLPLLSAAEREELRAKWHCRTPRRFPEKCVHELFEQQVSRQPHAVALVCREESITYSELDRRADQLARYLRRLGVGPEVLVAICLARSPESIVALLAVLKAGGAFVPFDPDYPAERLKFLVRDTRCAVLLTSTDFAAKFSCSPAKIVCLDTEQKLWESSDDFSLPPQAAFHHLAYVLYTSGSTGKPNGVCIEHAQFSNYTFSILEALELDAGMSYALAQPLTADASLTTIVAALCSGGALHLISKETALDAQALGDYFQEHRIDYFKATPSHLQALHSGIEPGQVLPRRRLVLGGEPSSWDWLQNLQRLKPECRIFNQYGPTETTIGVLLYQLGEQEEVEYYSVAPLNRRVANTEIHILDRYLQDLPIGVAGELCIGGAGLARGYLNRQDLTSEKFIVSSLAEDSTGRLYRTGDMARFRAGGGIEYLGRADHQVKVRGFRVEPFEVSSVLSQHPKVEKAVVVGRNDSTHTMRLIAYYVSTEESPPAPDELKQYLENQLPAYMMPAAFVELKDFPLHGQGKINLSALPHPEAAPAPVAELFTPARDWVEARLVRLWEEVLQVTPVGIRDSFFQLGGHSLSSVRLMNRIHHEFKKSFPVSLLFKYPTVEQFASAIRGQGEATGWNSLVEIQPGGTHAPLFLIPGIGGNIICFKDLAKYLGRKQPVFAVQPVGSNGGVQLLSSVEERAAHHIAVIKEVQPDGPYCLGGYSFGGKIAFEMALQLQAAGENVSFLAIFDGTAPRAAHSATEEQMEDAQTMLEIAKEYGVELNDEELRALAQEELFEQSSRESGKTEAFFVEEQLPHLKRILRMVRHYRQIKYQPQSLYRSQIALFRTNKKSIPPRTLAKHPEAALGWDSYSTQPVEIHFVEGEHHNMLREPQVQSLAKLVSTCLLKIRGDSEH